eukprot:TRINITY_DN46506_c0_g1_i1.p1 TRINITY_DN46506_c0_g1~~TRINITY_DN46506_c0_g1_i1.p1  ORF type:complete len:719 (-),score=179.64 TRINITY_DN46506_c0_g1_i1:29-2113(-)
MSNWDWGDEWNNKATSSASWSKSWESSSSWNAAGGGGGAATDANDAWGAWNRSGGSSGSGAGGGGDAWGPSNDWGSNDAWGENNGKDSWGASAWSGNWDKEDMGKDIDREIDWSGQQLHPIKKKFYQPHPKVRERTLEQDNEIRRGKDIEILDCKDEIPPKPVETFNQVGFPPQILKKISNNEKIQKPTPIQAQVIPAALEGHDLIGIAETGSGKTLAYLLPMLLHIMAQGELREGEGPIGIVLCPTRELAEQIDRVTKEFIADDTGIGVTSCCLIGGGNSKEQKWQVQRKNDIIVATPGRFIQCLNDKWTNLNRVTFTVLDEADEMLSKGFKEQIDLILSQVRPDRQMLMFSATWGKDVQELAVKHCNNSPMTIRVGGDKLAACKTIAQKVTYAKSDDDKYPQLVQAVTKTGCHVRGSEKKCLIFCNAKARVGQVRDELRNKGIESAMLTGDLQQWERSAALQEFRDGQQSILVCTNVLGRGHDIPRVKFVINFDLPKKIEDYVHRIGRTGRAGEKGFALTFVTEKDWDVAADLVAVMEATGMGADLPNEVRELAKGGGYSSWTSDFLNHRDENSQGNAQDAWENYNKGGDEQWSGQQDWNAQDQNWNEQATQDQGWNEQAPQDQGWNEAQEQPATEVPAETPAAPVVEPEAPAPEVAAPETSRPAPGLSLDGEEQKTDAQVVNMDVGDETTA